MGLSVNTNLNAQGIINNLEANSASYSQSVRRLSSGMRINSAADDPSGLIQAQKYQSQVTGLGQAIANANDAINLVQTAEGAMDQISKQLQAMRTLALHAANAGVNDASAQAADQQQIKDALSTISSIVSNTQFGNKKLLDGSAGIGGTATDANASVTNTTTSTKAGVYTMQVTQAATQGSVAGDGLKQVAVTGSGGTGTTAAAAGSTVTIATAGNLSSSGGNVVVDISGLNLSQAVNAINSNSALKGKVVASTTDDGNNLVIKSAQVDSTTTSTANSSGEMRVTVNNGANIWGMTDATLSTGSLTQASSSALTNVDETLSFSNGLTGTSAKSVDVVIKSGTSLADAVKQINSAVSNAGIGVTASLTNSMQLKITNNDYGSNTNAGNTAGAVSNTVATNTATVAAGAGLQFMKVTTAETIASVQAGSVTTNGAKVDGLDVQGSFNGHAFVGNGQTATGATGEDEDGLSVKYAGATVPPNNSAGSVTVSNNSLIMQLGAFAGQTSTASISNMSTDNLGTSATGTTVLTGVNVKLSNIDVTGGTNGAGAQDALRVIDAAIAQVAKSRADLGAFQQQTLQATISSNQVAQQNMTTTLSSIQDANVAQETVNYTKAQILQQQAISILANANQQPQQLMKLFQ